MISIKDDLKVQSIDFCNQKVGALLFQENKYVLVNNLYINLDMDILTLGRMLFFKAKPLELDSSIPFPIINKLPSRVNKTIRVARLCIKFIIQKNFTKNKEILNTNQFGHVLLKRQLNNISIDKSVYKIIDFNSKHMISEYDSSVNIDEMLQDIQKIKAIENLKISPKLLEVNLEDIYYIEEYRNLKHPNYKQWDESQYLIKKFISKLYEYFPFKEINGVEHIQDYNYNFDENIKTNPLFSDQINEITKYLKGKLEYINNFDLKNVIFAQSHGDLNSNNFFINEKEIIGIDWELLEYRPLYYDVFYFILIVNRKDYNLTNADTLNIETKEVIEYLNKQFNPEIIMTKDDIDLYLTYFILDYLNWKLRVYLTYKNDNDFKRRLLEVIKDISYFEKIGNKIIDTF